MRWVVLVNVTQLLVGELGFEPISVELQSLNMFFSKLETNTSSHRSSFLDNVYFETLKHLNNRL